MIKSLKELSLQVSEKEYREHYALSYSTIASYEKGGFSVIPHLFDKKESEALLFGSMVDTLITEGMDVFNSKFAIADFEIPTEAIKNIVDAFIESYPDCTLNDDDNIALILNVCNKFEYQTRWKDDTRVSKVRELGSDYFEAMHNVGSRTIVSNDLYQEVLATVSTLKTQPQTAKYLQQTKEGSDVEFLYQTKFTTTLEGLELKCMFDLLIVNHRLKVIIPIDLKTSSMMEYDFPKKYLENRYDLQSRLYYKILKNIISNDNYFKEFEIDFFKFMVINKYNRVPLMFKDDYSKVEGDIEFQFKSGSTKILRNPVTIAKELKNYLTTAAIVPEGIDILGMNSIRERLQLL
jgi:hypothetical protein